jgi:glutaredoxin
MARTKRAMNEKAVKETSFSNENESTEELLQLMINQNQLLMMQTQFLQSMLFTQYTRPFPYIQINNIYQQYYMPQLNKIS